MSMTSNSWSATGTGDSCDCTWIGPDPIPDRCGVPRAGTRPGPADGVLLMELLGLRELDVTLACRLQRTAVEHGVGAWLLFE
jgi:hypothetical protein